jgi:hypothetical protein
MCCSFCWQVRTFSRDELKSLFKVDPNIKCDTHNAIKCSCNGSAAAAEAKAAAFAASAGEVAGDGAADAAAGNADKLGVQAWAHYADAADATVDPMWDKVGSFVRDNFVTYIFSDHTLLEPKQEDPSSCQQPDDDNEDDPDNVKDSTQHDMEEEEY